MIADPRQIQKDKSNVTVSILHALEKANRPPLHVFTMTRAWISYSSDSKFPGRSTSSNFINVDDGGLVFFQSTEATAAPDLAMIA